MSKESQISIYKTGQNADSAFVRTSEQHVTPIVDMEKAHERCRAIINGSKKVSQPKATQVRLKGGILKKLRGSDTLKETSKKSKVNLSTVNNAERSMRVNRSNAMKICSYFRIELDDLIVKEK